MWARTLTSNLQVGIDVYVESVNGWIADALIESAKTVSPASGEENSSRVIEFIGLDGSQAFFRIS